MAKSETKANEIIKLIEQGKSVDLVKTELSILPDEWNNFSNKAYNIYLAKGKKERKGIENKKHVSATSNKQVLEIIDLNDKLGDYALLLPIFATDGEIKAISDLATKLPRTETDIIKIIGKITLHPHLRALQKKRRIEKLDYFKVFSKLIDAAILSYYRTNFISCYLTLLPVIEGVIIRWMGYTEASTKPEFEDVRKFFKNHALRQPCPHKVLFHNVYVKACDKILSKHFYKPTTTGISWANFNRHVASHLLNDNQFGTKENCIRLFILLDTMTEIYVYESRKIDPSNIGNDEIEEDMKLYWSAIFDNSKITPEQTLFGTNILDLTI